MTKDF
jgi:hypothetical protein